MTRTPTWPPPLVQACLLCLCKLPHHAEAWYVHATWQAVIGSEWRRAAAHSFFHDHVCPCKPWPPAPLITTRSWSSDAGAAGGVSAAQEAARAAFVADKGEGFYSSDDEESQSSTSLSTATSAAGGPKYKVWARLSTFRDLFWGYVKVAGSHIGVSLDATRKLAGYRLDLGACKRN